MQLGIIGFPQSGKSTIFQAVTGGKGETSKPGKPALGVVKVPDPRLAPLAAIFKPKKVVMAEITYLDIPGGAGLGKGKGIEGLFLNELARVDALIHVVGAFQHPERDGAKLREEIANMEMELAFSDLSIIERRLQRVDSSMKSNKPQERDAAQKEKALLTRLKDGLEADVPVREQKVNPDERPVLNNFQLLTSKPLIVVLNIGEEQLPRAEQAEVSARRPDYSNDRPVAVCGKLEAELALMDESDAQAFRKDAGIKESSLMRMVRLSYDAVGLETFLTVGPDEVRAWSVPRGSAAPKAAGKIHSDIERGFIRAEVVTYEDLITAGGLPEARKRGVLRMEGKNYTVKDGDVINFLFNV